MKYDTVIFDLDGTLLDTSPGIYNSVRYAERMMPLPPVPEGELPAFVGPPPKEMYRKIYGLTNAAAAQAARFHREYGKTRGFLESSVYDGIPELLTGLRAAGFRLGVATLKSQSIAEAVLVHHGLAHFFQTVVGMDADETMDKAATITAAAAQVKAVKAVMVGDTEYDRLGAAQAAVDFIGVSYGFGFKDAAAAGVSVVASPRELLRIILGTA